MQVTLLSDPRVAAVPVEECGEPMRDVREAGLLLDAREADADAHYANLREGVVQRLLTAEKALPDGVRLLIIEGHRRAEEQSRRFENFARGVRDSGVTDPDEVRRSTSAFVSPVEVAPHCTGGALDLTLVDAAGRELPMGGAVNAHRTGDETSCPFGADGLPEEARVNRQLIAEALIDVVFVNYPPNGGTGRTATGTGRY